MTKFIDALRNGFKNVTDAEQAKKAFKLDHLFVAVRENDIEKIHKVIQSGKVEIDRYNLVGQTAFHTAIRYGAKNAAETLVSLGCDPLLPVKGVTQYENPIHLAIDSDQPHMIDFLKSVGWSLNEKSKNGWTPMCHAVAKNKEDSIKALVDAGVNGEANSLAENFKVAIFGRQKSTFIRMLDIPAVMEQLMSEDQNRVARARPVFIALEAKNFDFAIEMFDRGMSVNCINYRQQSPLHLGILNESEELCEYLIKKGADLNKAHDSQGRSPFALFCMEMAAKSDDDARFVENIFPLFVRYGGDLNEKLEKTVMAGKNVQLQKMWHDAKEDGLKIIRKQSFSAQK